MAADKRIPELPQIVNLSPSMKSPVYDPLTDTTYHTDLVNILPSSSDQDYRWSLTVSYSTGEIVTASNKIWLSLQDDNLSNVPVESSFWTEVSKSQSGLIFWQAGVFFDSDVNVKYASGGNTNIYYLDPSISRPFNSTNFISELAAGKWKLVGSSSGGSASNRDYSFRFNSNLFTEQALSFQGLISSLSQSITNKLASVSYETRLDSVSTFIPQSNLTNLQSWINTNVSGNELTGTKYWIKCVATYNSGQIGEAENHFRFTAT